MPVKEAPALHVSVRRTPSEPGSPAAEMPSPGASHGVPHSAGDRSPGATRRSFERARALARAAFTVATTQSNTDEIVAAKTAAFEDFLSRGDETATRGSPPPLSPALVAQRHVQERARFAMDPACARGQSPSPTLRRRSLGASVESIAEENEEDAEPPLPHTNSLARGVTPGFNQACPAADAYDPDEFLSPPPFPVCNVGAIVLGDPDDEAP